MVLATAFEYCWAGLLTRQQQDYANYLNRVALFNKMDFARLHGSELYVARSVVRCRAAPPSGPSHPLAWASCQRMRQTSSPDFATARGRIQDSGSSFFDESPGTIPRTRGAGAQSAGRLQCEGAVAHVRHACAAGIPALQWWSASARCACLDTRGSRSAHALRRNASSLAIRTRLFAPLLALARTATASWR
jgi:hypothetical protein